MMSVNIMSNQHELCTKTYISKIVKFFEDEYYRYLTQTSVIDWDHLAYLIKSLAKRVYYPNSEVQNLVLCYLTIHAYYNHAYKSKVNVRDFSYLATALRLRDMQVYMQSVQLELCFGRYKMKSWIGNGFFIFKLTNGKHIKICSNPQGYIVDLPKIVHKAINDV